MITVKRDLYYQFLKFKEELYLIIFKYFKQKAGEGWTVKFGEVDNMLNEIYNYIDGNYYPNYNIINARREFTKYYMTKGIFQKLVKWLMKITGTRIICIERKDYNPVVILRDEPKTPQK